MNKYELAVAETRSVLSEWMADDRIASEFSRGVLAGKIVERLVAKGVIQSTDPDDLRDFRGRWLRRFADDLDDDVTWIVLTRFYPGRRCRMAGADDVVPRWQRPRQDRDPAGGLGVNVQRVRGCPLCVDHGSRRLKDFVK